MKTKKLTELAMLTGVALVMFVVELQIPNPFPIPGIKLGLANIVTVFSTAGYAVIIISANNRAAYIPVLSFKRDRVFR